MLPGNMYTMNQVLENSYTTGVAISPNGTSLIDDRNPITGPGQQGTAFGVFGGGVQQAGTAGNSAACPLTSRRDRVALDLYRVLGRNNVSGQVGGTVREGSYEGSVVLGTNGQVSFISGISAVPEPSGALALGLLGTVAGLGYRRRRNA